MHGVVLFMIVEFTSEGLGGELSEIFGGVGYRRCCAPLNQAESGGRCPIALVSYLQADARDINLGGTAFVYRDRIFMCL